MKESLRKKIDVGDQNVQATELIQIERIEPIADSCVLCNNT